MQKTIKHEIRIEGVGLHSGRSAQVLIQPAGPNSGIFFVRSDIPNSPKIPASFDCVTQTRLATTLGIRGVEVSTVEHLLAALKLSGVDNAVIYVNSPEVPILDGSALPFLEAIHDVGTVDQPVARRYARLVRAVEVMRDGKIARIEPSDVLKIDAVVRWDHPMIGEQRLHFELGNDSPLKIASARTFGFFEDVEALQRMGLARGGSLANAVVLDETGVMNPEGLRFKDEFVRHKVLDAIGDFALAPVSFVGRVKLYKAGHELHRDLVRAIFSDAANFVIESDGALVEGLAIATPWEIAPLEWAESY